MDNKFAKRLEEYLESECADYGFSYKWRWEPDTECVEVEISNELSITNESTKKSKLLNFRYNEKDDDLLIELSEDSFYVTREFNETVKYFWMLVSPIFYN